MMHWQEIAACVENETVPARGTCQRGRIAGAAHVPVIEVDGGDA